MALTEQQLQQLNAQCNKLPIAKLLEYIDKGFVRFPEDLPALSDDRKKAIADLINSRPNPQEQAEWRAIQGASASLLNPSLKSMTLAYISKWEPSQPTGNHVEEAKVLLENIKEALRQKSEEEEREAWEALDKQDIDAILAYLDTYPETGHQDEIEQMIWPLLKEQNDSLTAANKFLKLFPDSPNTKEAKAIVATYQGWEDVKMQYDLLPAYEYLQAHPESPFADEAREMVNLLKNEEIEGMRELLANYPIENLFYYLKNGIFTESELIEAGVATEESMKILRDLERIKDGLPDVNAEIAKCKKECANDRTDVFFFGIPSTGKTCILMGLIGCKDIDIDTVRAGGPYSAVLDQYLGAGLTIGQTPKDFVATIQAEVMEGTKRHLLNLVEMSGEDFAFKIANDENGKISFEDMANGATRLLCNNNRKVFFIIVDPTARTVAFNHLVESPDGSYLVRTNVNQRTILKRMVDLLRQPENQTILKKVDAINIIVTKSDTLGNEEERDQKALDHFREQYDNIIAPLTRLCQQFNINTGNAGRPKLYSFSLGQFYVGGIYKYNDSDAKKLVQVLKNNTDSYKSGGFADKLKKVFN